MSDESESRSGEPSGGVTKPDTFILQDGGTHRVQDTDSDEQGRVRYRLGDLLGKGGLGEVHNAVDLLLEREVALKASTDEHPGALERFWHEARVTAVLDHPNIVPIYDGGMLGEQPFFTMKRIEGRNLAEAILDGPPMSLREKLDIIRNVCDAIEYAHSKRWLHRDLKPDNIMLGPFGEVLVVDWGIAASLDSPEPPMLAGTPRYMAPEQARGEALDGRADVYALGSVLWFALSGEDPFPEEGDSRALIKHLRGEGYQAPEHPDIPPELLAIIRKALAGDRRDRYPSVHLLKQDILAYVDGGEVSAVEYSRTQRLSKWADRHRRRLLVGLATSTVVLGALGLAALVAGAAIYRSAGVERESAQRAQKAETEMREQLVEALVAGAAAHVAGDRYRPARETLQMADSTGERPFMGLAWADLTTRGVWPVARIDPEGATPSAIALGPSFALLTRADGTWETRDLLTGDLRTQGRVPGRPLVVVDARRMLGVEGRDLVLVDVFEGEIARVPRAYPDVRVERAWEAGDRVLVQSYQDGKAPPVTAWSLPRLERQPLPVGIESLFVHAVGPWGNTVLGSPEGRPDQLGAGEVRRLSDGIELAKVARLQAFIGRDVVYEVQNRAVQARELKTNEILWTRPGFPGIRGAETRGGVVAVADGEGRILVLDARTGAERAMLLGLEQRPIDVGVDRTGRWVFAAGVDGRLVSWRLPETPVGWWLGASMSGDAHPDGRLLVTATDGAIRVVDVPSATEVARLELGGAGGQPVWSPDGSRVAFVEAGRLAVWDVVGRARVEVPEVAAEVAVWGASQLVVSAAEGVVRLDPESFEVLDRFASVGNVWGGEAGPDGSVVLASSKRADDGVGFRIPAGGPPEPLASGGSPETTGYGVAMVDGVWMFGRQDGRIVRWTDGGPAEAWAWQAAPVSDLVKTDEGVVAVGFDGRIHGLDAEGRPLYTLGYSPDPLLWVERVGDRLVVGGERGIREIPLDGRRADDATARLMGAHAWGGLADTALEGDAALTVALGRREGVAEALEGRTDVVAEILRGP